MFKFNYLCSQRRSMELRNLASISKHDVYDAFSKAFHNYVLPMNLKEEDVLLRWERSGVDFNLSYGVFDNNELVAFVLHTILNTSLYNFATGVLPSYRGQHLIERIYKEVQDELKGFDEFVLEVIKENLPAFNLYKKLGFAIQRELVSLSGELRIALPENMFSSYKIKPLLYTDEMKKLQLAEPGIERSYPALLRNEHLHEVHELRKNNKLVAFAIFTPEGLSLDAIGARQPSHFYLDELFLNMKLNFETIRVINIDGNSLELLEYFKGRGLLPFVTQYEMKKKLC